MDNPNKSLFSAKNNKFAFLALIGAVTLVLLHGLLSLSLSRKVDPVIVTLEAGDSLTAIAQKLSEGKVINSAFWFGFYARISGVQNHLQAGKYQFEKKINSPEVLTALVNAEALQEEISILIPEGFNVWEIDQRLSDVGIILNTGSFARIALQHEGYLFPDTYRFSRGTSPGIILRAMRRNFKEKTTSFAEELDERILVIASMLEKEVRSPQDMRLVAGIIERRLALGQQLQIDAAVTYGVCRALVEQTQELVSSEIESGLVASLIPQTDFFDGRSCNVVLVPVALYLDFNSSYNTYKNFNLPPTPISNPGIESISAALNPQPSEYLYYLNPRGGGATIFSRSDAEHEAARRKFLGL